MLRSSTAVLLLMLLVSWLRKGDSCFLPAVANEVTISAIKEMKGINSNVAMKLNTQSRKSTAHACARTNHAALALGQV